MYDIETSTSFDFQSELENVEAEAAAAEAAWLAYEDRRQRDADDGISDDDDH